MQTPAALSHSIRTRMAFRGVLLSPSLRIALLLSAVSGTARAESIARTWSEEILAAIRLDRPNPPVHARNLFHLATVMYDGWSAYDTVAVGYIQHERATAADVDAARRETISYAAYRLLKSRYANSASFQITQPLLDQHFLALGYDKDNTSTVGNTPAALGNRIAANVMAWSLADGCNQAGGYSDPFYFNSQPPMIVLFEGSPVGGIPAGTNPNLWQPLALDKAVDQNGFPIPGLVQTYVGVTWLNTAPFSLQRTDSTKPWIDPGPPSYLGTATDASYKANALSVLRDSSRLNDPTIIDISPGDGGVGNIRGVGNNPLGTDDGHGRPLNPVTGLPYAPNPVKRGDFARVLAEFWADGPQSETPPGHWHVLANQMADNPLTVKKIGGTGPVVSDLEWDVKTYLTLAGATHNAACACWSIKRYYQGVRPITMIRYMASKGQSSNPALPSYHVQGLPLEAGVVELITDVTAAAGGRHEGVGNAGEIAVYSWPGEPADRATQTSPVRWMKGVNWLPYQRKNFNTPAFPGYTSGHSTFSRAAAEALAAITGTPYFPGGLGTFTANAQTYLVFERGPTETTTLQWATYYDAADQSGQSRRWGGIHPPEDDYAARIIGSQVGISSWQEAQKYWTGSVLNERSIATIKAQSGSQATVSWTCVRGMYYKLQESTDFKTWTDTTENMAAYGTNQELTVPITAEAPRKFYRVKGPTTVP